MPRRRPCSPDSGSISPHRLLEPDFATLRVTWRRWSPCRPPTSGRTEVKELSRVLPGAGRPTGRQVFGTESWGIGRGRPNMGWRAHPPAPRAGMNRRLRTRPIGARCMTPPGGNAALVVRHVSNAPMAGDSPHRCCGPSSSSREWPGCRARSARPYVRCGAHEPCTSRSNRAGCPEAARRSGRSATGRGELPAPAAVSPLSALSDPARQSTA